MPVTIIRDSSKDNYLDFSTGKEETGIFGINIAMKKDGLSVEAICKYNVLSKEEIEKL